MGDPIPCSETSVDGSGSGGGSGLGGDSGSGDNGGNSGGGSSGGGGSFGCIYQGVYVVGCQGDNNDTLHPIGECWNPSGSGVVEYDIWECYGDPVNPTSPNQGEGEGRTVNEDCPECETNDGGIGINTNKDLVGKAAIMFINECMGIDQARNSVLLNNELEAAAANYLDTNGCNAQTKQFVETVAEVVATEQFLLFEQDYKSRMSPTELVLFEDLSRWDQIAYLSAAYKAEKLALENFPNMNQRNTKADAFRHAYWNAQASIGLGATLTETMTTAHENQPPSYPYSYLETQMDLHNNSEGISRRNFLSDGFSSLEESILFGVSNGNLVYLSHLDPVSSLATSSSQVIPTNQ